MLLLKLAQNLPSYNKKIISQCLLKMSTDVPAKIDIGGDINQEIVACITVT